MKNIRKSNAGFTLMELMAYMGLFVMLLTVIYSVYYQFSRTFSAADATLIKERGAFDVVRRLQNDIRKSEEIADAFGPFKASDGVLILMADDEETPEKKVIIYKHLASRKTLVRYQTTTAEGTLQNVSSQGLGHGIENFDFSIDQKSPKLVKVSILVKEGPLGILRNRPFSFYALMRNG